MGNGVTGAEASEGGLASSTGSGRPLTVSGTDGRVAVDGDALSQLSRSLPTSAPVLESEPCDVAVLRPVVSNQSRNGEAVGSLRRGGGGGGLDDRQTDHGPDLARHTETSPLLPPRDSPLSADPAGDSSTGTGAGNDDEDPPYLNGVSPGRFWFVFSQLLLAQFIACFDGTIMASSHPVITSYFGAANSASWLSTAFLLASTAFQPLLGRLSDAVGRKPLFLGCLVVFALATAWCAAAASIESFIVARALCGLGAGGSMTLGSIITSDLVPIEYVVDVAPNSLTLPSSPEVIFRYRLVIVDTC